MCGLLGSCAAVYDILILLLEMMSLQNGVEISTKHKKPHI